MARAEISGQKNLLPTLLQQRTVQSLVLFRALQLGDMLCALPALRALRTALPDTHITLVGLPWAKQFAHRFHRYIDDFIPFPGHAALPEQAVREKQIPDFYEAMREKNIDMALQMHGDGHISNRIVHTFGAAIVAGYGGKQWSDRHPERFFPYPENGAEPLRLLQLAEFLGAPACGTHLEFPVTPEDDQELNESGLNAGLVPGQYLCIHPGARSRDKCWPPQHFAAVADRLSEESGLSIVLTGSAQEADLTAAVAAHMRYKARNAAAPISIGAMAALMSRARLLICNDTGVSHIAAGLKLPSVVIFSKADIHRWSPLEQTRHRCIQDPKGEQAASVLQLARLLLQENTPCHKAWHPDS